MFTHEPGKMARIVVISAFLPFLRAAEPPLTTIQDVLYKADGTRFNGYVQISWNSFEAAILPISRPSSARCGSSTAIFR